MTAAGMVGLIDALNSAGVKTFADKGHQGRQHDPNAVQAASPSALVVSRAARQPTASAPSANAPSRLEELEGADQAALLSASSDCTRADHPRPAAHRGGPLLRMKGAQ